MCGITSLYANYDVLNLFRKHPSRRLGVDVASRQSREA